MIEWATVKAVTCHSSRLQSRGEEEDAEHEEDVVEAAGEDVGEAEREVLARDGEAIGRGAGGTERRARLARLDPMRLELAALAFAVDDERVAARRQRPGEPKLGVGIGKAAGETHRRLAAGVGRREWRGGRWRRRCGDVLEGGAERRVIRGEGRCVDECLLPREQRGAQRRLVEAGRERLSGRELQPLQRDVGIELQVDAKGAVALQEHLDAAGAELVRARGGGASERARDGERGEAEPAMTHGSPATKVSVAHTLPKSAPGPPAGTIFTALTSHSPPRGSAKVTRPSASLRATSGFAGSSRDSAATWIPAIGLPSNSSRTCNAPPPPSFAGSTSGTNSSGNPTTRSNPALSPPPPEPRTTSSDFTERVKRSRTSAFDCQPAGICSATPSSATKAAIFAASISAIEPRLS